MIKDPVIVRNLKGTQFSTSLAQNVLDTENITGLGIDEGVITSIILQSDQNLAWDLYIWETDGFDDTDLDADKLIGFITFATTDGLRIAGAGQYYYAKHDLYIPYRDLDHTEELHLGLVNRSATGKNAGATGEFVAELVIQGGK